MRVWRLTLFCEDAQGKRTRVASGTFYADTADDAKECALAAWWPIGASDSGYTPAFNIEEAD